MEDVLILRGKNLGTCIAYKSIDTGKLIPPNGYTLAAMQSLTNLGVSPVCVKIGDETCLYTARDGIKCVDTKKIDKITQKAADILGWTQAKNNYFKSNPVKPKSKSR